MQVAWYFIQELGGGGREEGRKAAFYLDVFAWLMCTSAPNVGQRGQPQAVSYE
jgi:hypothetical protein